MHVTRAASDANAAQQRTLRRPRRRGGRTACRDVRSPCSVSRSRVARTMSATRPPWRGPRPALARAARAAFDPPASANAERELPDLQITASAELALQGADAAIIATDWPVFRVDRLGRRAHRLRQPARRSTVGGCSTLTSCGRSDTPTSSSARTQRSRRGCPPQAHAGASAPTSPGGRLVGQALSSSRRTGWMCRRSRSRAPRGHPSSAAARRSRSVSLGGGTVGVLARAQDHLPDGRGVDPLREVDHLADPLGREVRPDGVAGGIEQVRDLGQVLGLRQLLAQGEQDLLLAPARLKSLSPTPWRERT